MIGPTREVKEVRSLVLNLRRIVDALIAINILRGDIVTVKIVEESRMEK